MGGQRFSETYDQFLECYSYSSMRILYSSVHLSSCTPESRHRVGHFYGAYSYLCSMPNFRMSCTSLQIPFLLLSCGLLTYVIAQQNLCGPTTLQLTKPETDFVVPSGGKFTQGTTCLYDITGMEGKKITIKITSLYLGLGLNCKTDYIKVAESKASLNSTTQFACGNIPRDFSVSTNRMAIEIKVTAELEKDFVKAVLVQSGCPSLIPSFKWISMVLVTFWSIK
ncbi:hypothetical protein D915_006522 [Fasciola hepatica]|uniref:CUB domain-containing protein n=1 Tax=Fasciola hepatica TaxID=6192 RepID=A0A4E0R7B9_FASHE|nr:hypothetical protein D915_006522 [Fasciola hepatica]